ncbi:hypothetical protein NS506_04436 [Nocardia seriolae]|uniref:Uncharacterized protein n=1 Tax=Nocardia seriolae TaxID=37332 RepID=A0ABC8AWD6_9NOCA|nr:hypothetical protein NS506_04436 [Nocardia seriolae]
MGVGVVDPAIQLAGGDGLGCALHARQRPQPEPHQPGRAARQHQNQPGPGHHLDGAQLTLGRVEAVQRHHDRRGSALRLSTVRGLHDSPDPPPRVTADLTHLEDPAAPRRDRRAVHGGQLQGRGPDPDPPDLRATGIEEQDLERGRHPRDLGGRLRRRRWMIRRRDIGGRPVQLRIDPRQLGPRQQRGTQHAEAREPDARNRDHGHQQPGPQRPPPQPRKPPRHLAFRRRGQRPIVHTRHLNTAHRHFRGPDAGRARARLEFRASFPITDHPSQRRAHINAADDKQPTSGQLENPARPNPTTLRSPIHRRPDRDRRRSDVRGHRGCGGGVPGIASGFPGWGHVHPRRGGQDRWK